MNWETQTGFCPQCGDVIAPRDFVNGSHQCKKTHKITLTFTTDRTPTEQEFLELMDTLCLQIEEPMNLNNEEHTYKTSAIRADLERGLN
jgi:hypothetical protein